METTPTTHAPAAGGGTLPRGGARPPGLRHGRGPVTAVFFLNGLTLASYLVRLPSLKEAHHLSDGRMGVVGLLFATAALISMQFVGRLVARWGSDLVLRLALLALPAALACVGLAGGVAAYTAASVLLGAVNGTLDVAMNAQAVAVERSLGRPVLSGCHAAWSVSAVTASLTGVGLIKSGVPVAPHLVGVAAVVIVAGLALGRRTADTAPVEARQAAPDVPAAVRPEAHPQSGPEDRDRPAAAAWRAGWTRTVVRLGITGTVLMICEGAALGWGAIFLRDAQGAGLALASAAVTAFTGCQTAGRLVGDRLRLTRTDAALFRTGGLVGTAGLALAVLAPHPVLAVAGFGVLGLGTALLIPLTFSAVGRATDRDGAAAFLSKFTTFTYAGILLGPALIGWSAQFLGLRATFAALVPLLACVALLTRLPANPSPSAPAPREGGQQPRPETGYQDPDLGG